MGGQHPTNGERPLAPSIVNPGSPSNSLIWKGAVTALSACRLSTLATMVQDSGPLRLPLTNCVHWRNFLQLGLQPLVPHKRPVEFLAFTTRPVHSSYLDRPRCCKPFCEWNKNTAWLSDRSISYGRCTGHPPPSLIVSQVRSELE